MGARGSEFSPDGGLWEIPAGRTKPGGRSRRLGVPDRRMGRPSLLSETHNGQPGRSATPGFLRSARSTRAGYGRTPSRSRPARPGKRVLRRAQPHSEQRTSRQRNPVCVSSPLIAGVRSGVANPSFRKVRHLNDDRPFPNRSQGVNHPRVLITIPTQSKLPLCESL
jgi:hypothetical protein